MAMRKLKDYTPTRFMAPDSHYDKDAADYAVAFIESLCHTKGKWAGKPFELIDWQERIVRDIFEYSNPMGIGSSTPPTLRFQKARQAIGLRHTNSDPGRLEADGRDTGRRPRFR